MKFYLYARSISQITQIAQKYNHNLRPPNAEKRKNKIADKTVIDNKELGFLKKLPCIYANWGKRGETKGEESAMTN